jgi:hypothetical protein
MQGRWFWLTASLGVGLLQAWDAGAMSAGVPVLLLTVAGIALPCSTIAMRMPHGGRMLALAAGALLLVAARTLAPASLNGLHLALFPATFYILVARGLVRDGQQHVA